MRNGADYEKGPVIRIRLNAPGTPSSILTNRDPKPRNQFLAYAEYIIEGKSEEERPLERPLVNRSNFDQAANAYRQLQTRINNRFASGEDVSPEFLDYVYDLGASLTPRSRRR